MDLSNNLLSLTETFGMNGGKLVGPGVLNGSVESSSVVFTGIPPGDLQITGNYIETPSAKLQIQLSGGESTNSLVPLRVGGHARLYGKREFHMSGYQPTNGSLLQIARFSSTILHAGCFESRMLLDNWLLEEHWSKSSLDISVNAFSPQEAAVLKIDVCSDLSSLITVLGQPGVKYSLLSSSDMLSWVELKKLSSATGLMELTDLNATGEGTKYYRAVKLLGGE